MSACKDESPAMQAYRLGCVAGTLFVEKPEGWQRKIRANIRKARKLGVVIDPKAFGDLTIPNCRR